MNTLALDSETAPLTDVREPAPAELPVAEPPHRPASLSPPRPAWIEIDLCQLKRNFQYINHDKRPGVEILSIVKDQAYGHGALRVGTASAGTRPCRSLN